MIKDAIGNELQIGDTVHVQIYPGTWISGVISHMKPGGISFALAMPKNGEQHPTTPDIIGLQLLASLQGPAGLPHNDIVKLAAKNVVDQITESSVKM